MDSIKPEADTGDYDAIDRAYNNMLYITYANARGEYCEDLLTRNLSITFPFEEQFSTVMWDWGNKSEYYLSVFYTDINWYKNVEVKNSSVTAVNNGGNYVKYGDYTYYHEYSSPDYAEDEYENFEAPEIDEYSPWGRFSLSAQKKLVRIDDYGVKEEPFDNNDGYGGIFIYHERMFLEDDRGIFSVDLAGNDRIEYGEGYIYAFDENKGVFINAPSSSYIEVINCDTGGRKTISNGGYFLCYDYDNGVVYVENYYDDQIVIRSVNYDGTNEKLVAVVDRNILVDEYYFHKNSVTIMNLMIENGYLYFEYGAIGGMYGITRYSALSIARVKTDGTDFKVLAYVEDCASVASDGGDPGTKFLVINSNGNYYLIYGVYANRYASESKFQSLSLQDWSVTETDIQPQPVNEPFTDGKVNENYEEILIYPDDSGISKTLITKRDYAEIGITGENYLGEEFYQFIRDVELVGDWVYFTYEDGIHDEENDYVSTNFNKDSYAYIRQNTRVYRKNLTTSKIYLLYSY
jgi:hypothetical protein